MGQSPHSQVPAEPFSGWERRAVLGAFLIHLVFQVHAVGHHGYWGQDWIHHKEMIWMAANDPWQFFTHYTEERTNPPLYHLICAAVKRVVGAEHYLSAIGYLNVVLGMVGFGFAYGVIRALIASPVLRVASIVFILFLPFAMIHAQVIATDALATPLFWLLLWLALKLGIAKSGRSFAWLIAAMLVGIEAGLLVKFTFACVIPAVGAWALMLWRLRVFPHRRLMVVLAVLVAFPGVVAYRQSVQFRAEQTHSFGLRWPPRFSEAEMNPRSILWLRTADKDILSAPPYDWRSQGEYEVVRSNRHSFPALLHLAMFTDILNVFQYDPYDDYFGRRTQQNHERMKIAVRTGIFFSALALGCVIPLLLRSGFKTVLGGDPSYLGMVTVGIFSCAWFGMIVAPLPLVPQAYSAAYWHPRLLIPALVGFYVLTFIALDRLGRWSKAIHVTMLGAVLAQSALHASFLWATRNAAELYEPDSDLAFARDPTVRVFNWHDGYRGNYRGEYWLSDTIGIVINRPAGAPGLETWRLSFTIARGLSGESNSGTLRISSPHFGPELVEFDGMKTVLLSIPVAIGRNDIAVEIVAPKPVERAGDCLIRAFQVSAIEVRPPGVEKPVPISP